MRRFSLLRLYSYASELNTSNEEASNPSHLHIRSTATAAR